MEAALAERLAAYGALLLAENRRLNLTGAKDAHALVEHLLDSLTLLSEITIGMRLADIGSGGGLPAIPLGLAGGVELLLVEATAKKAAFLERALRELGLAGTVVAERAEVAGRDPRYREQYDVATARAVATAPAVAELTLPFVRIGGKALLQRGVVTDAERVAVTDAAPMLGASVAEERLLSGQRRILILRKTAATPQRFPRLTGIPEKRPLCFDR